MKKGWGEMKIRQVREVRLMDSDDDDPEPVERCPKCGTSLDRNGRLVHCRHCGYEGRI